MSFRSSAVLSLGVSDANLQSPHDLLCELYLQQRRSQTELARVFRVQPQTISRWLTRLGIERRDQGEAVALAITKYHCRPFEGTSEEKAYQLGLRAGDLHAQTHGRRIRLSVGTTHPAMMTLFQSTFSRYAEVRRYPKRSDVSGFHWCIYCDLDPSFGFLHQKPMAIPRWILTDDSLFYFFLAGYFDAEGCITFDLRDHNKSVGLVLKSCDYEILNAINLRLTDMGLASRLTLALKAGENRLTRDFWRVQISRRGAACGLLRRLPLCHPEKVAKAQLASYIASTGWVSGWDSVTTLRRQIREEVRRFRSEAEDALLRGREQVAGPVQSASDERRIPETLGGQDVS